MVPSWEESASADARAGLPSRDGHPITWPGLAVFAGTAGVVVTSTIALLIVLGSAFQARAPRPSSFGMLEAPRSGFVMPTPIVPAASAPSAPTVRSAAAAPVGRKYAVSFGRFASKQQAEAQARKVRAKGYQASVVPAGTALQVVTRPYKDRRTAEFWSQVFKRVGLNAKVVALTEISQGPQLAAATDTAPRRASGWPFPLLPRA